MAFILPVIVYIFTIFQLTFGQQCAKKTPAPLDKHEELLKCLQNSYDPNIKLFQQTKVTIDIFYPKEIMFYQKNLYLVGQIWMKWMDENYVWNKTDYGGISKLHLRNSVKVWKPTLYSNAFANYGTNLKVFRNAILNENSGGAMRIFNTGLVLFTYLTTLSVLCPQYDVTYFPNDIKNCTIEIFSPNNITFIIGSDIQHAFKFFGQPKNYAVSKFDVVAAGVTNNSMRINLVFSQYQHMYSMYIHTPIIGICLFLLIPLWLTPSNVLRLIFPSMAFLYTIYQIQAISVQISTALFEAGDCKLIDLLRLLMTISYIMLIYNFICALLWKKKLFLPSLLNKMYAKLYAIDFCKTMSHADHYFNIGDDNLEENTENLETIFHTWSELLRLADVIICAIVFLVEAIALTDTISPNISTK